MSVLLMIPVLGLGALLLAASIVLYRYLAKKEKENRE
jgi:hypothetical protein